MPDPGPCASEGRGYQFTGKAHAGVEERAGGSASTSAVKVGTAYAALRGSPPLPRLTATSSYARGRRAFAFERASPFRSAKGGLIFGVRAVAEERIISVPPLQRTCQAAQRSPFDHILIVPHRDAGRGKEK
jgi:hypothetical protein